MTTSRAPRILEHGMPPAKESDILGQCRDYLRLKGWSVWRHQAGLGAPKGFPDLIAVRRRECAACGRSADVLFVEVKTPRGVLSDDQRKFQAAMEAQKGRYVVVRSLEDMIAFAREGGQ